MTNKARDYSREWQTRQKRNKRLAADMDRPKAEAFLNHLAAKGETYISWLNKQIDKELKRA
jgi:hypothetical protein